jgi:hypothetical protein
MRFIVIPIIESFPYRLFVVMVAIILKFLLNALPVGETWWKSGLSPASR